MMYNTIQKIVFHFMVMNMIYVSADLPDFVHRTEKCPIPNNVTDWRRASQRLSCKHDILSKSPTEQKFVYHCIPTSYLNETVEFCGKSVPSDGGYCPVYTYAFGENESPNFLNCSAFSEGCPKEFFFSKHVFKHPACLDIDKKNNCYRSDPTCCSDSCATKQNQSNEQETTNNEDSNIVTRNMAILLTGIAFLISLCGICSYLNITKVKGNVYSAIRKGNGEFLDLYPVRLADFLFTIGRELKPENVKRLKSALQGNQKERKYRKRCKKLNKIDDGAELLKFMDQLYDFSMNIYILQGFLEMIDKSGLAEKCMAFAERRNNIYINKYYRRENLEGYKKVTLILPKDDVHKITDERIQALRRNLMNLIDARFDDVVIRGISEGCVIIHTEMRPSLLSKIKRLGIYAEFIFKKYNISGVYAEQHCLYTSKNKSEPFNVEKICFQDEYCFTTQHAQDDIGQITTLLDFPDSLSFINIAIMGPLLRRNFTFVKMCTEALKSRTAISTRAALMTTSSNLTTPLTVISSKTRSGRPIQIRILESEIIQAMDYVVDSSTCAIEAITGRESLSELDHKIHCTVYALDVSKQKLYGYDEIDNEKIKNSLQDQDKPKLLLIWNRNFSEVNFGDLFKCRVQACDDFGIPLRLIQPACDPSSKDSHTTAALKSLLYMINCAREYASKNNKKATST